MAYCLDGGPGIPGNREFVRLAHVAALYENGMFRHHPGLDTQTRDALGLIAVCVNWKSVFGYFDIKNSGFNRHACRHVLDAVCNGRTVFAYSTVCACLTNSVFHPGDHDPAPKSATQWFSLAGIQPWRTWSNLIQP